MVCGIIILVVSLLFCLALARAADKEQPPL